MKNENQNFWYLESQGEVRDREIISRYRSMIRYFSENPQRIWVGDNLKILMSLYHNDMILQREETLRKFLRTHVLDAFLEIDFREIVEG